MNNHRPSTPIRPPTRRSIDGVSRGSAAARRVAALETRVSPPLPPSPTPAPAPSPAPVRILKPGHNFSRPITPAPPTTPVKHRPISQPPMSPQAHNTIIHSSVRTVESPDTATTHHVPNKSPKRKAKNKLITYASYAGIATLAVAVGFALFDAAVGQWVVIAGGIIALILRVDSRIIFGGALFCLVMIPVMTMAGREPLSENYAIYTFILLALGTIRAMIESASNGKKNNTIPSRSL